MSVKKMASPVQQSLVETLMHRATKVSVFIFKNKKTDETIFEALNNRPADQLLNLVAFFKFKIKL